MRKRGRKMRRTTLLIAAAVLGYSGDDVIRGGEHDDNLFGNGG